MASSKKSAAIADAATASAFSPLPLSLAQQKYQGVERTGAGFMLLQRMGWREGEGLVSSVRVWKRNELACHKLAADDGSSLFFRR